MPPRATMALSFESGPSSRSARSAKRLFVFAALDNRFVCALDARRRCEAAQAERRRDDIDVRFQEVQPMGHLAHMLALSREFIRRVHDIHPLRDGSLAGDEGP